MPKVAVVILNWNGKHLLEQFLPLVIQHSISTAEIIVADNASTDDSLLFLENTFPEIKVIKNGSNGGYARGYNEALKTIVADYYVLLNSDVAVTANWIQPCIALLERNKSTVACQPKILSYADKNQFEYAGAAGGFIDKYGYPFCRGRIFDTYEYDNGQYDNEQEIFWATGACLFIKADAYHEIGGFDEDFFAHMEEIDLCWRLKNKGYNIMYCPNAKVYHVGAGTLAKTSAKKTYLNFRNNLLLLVKNHNSKYLVSKILIRMVLDGIASIKFLLSADFTHFVAVFKAHLSFYRMLPHTLQKRQLFQNNITSYSTTAIYNGSIVYDYFIAYRKTFKQLKNKFL